MSVLWKYDILKFRILEKFTIFNNKYFWQYILEDLWNFLKKYFDQTCLSRVNSIVFLAFSNFFTYIILLWFSKQFSFLIYKSKNQCKNVDCKFKQKEA